MKIGKILKKTSKILLITILTIVLLIVTLLVTAKLSENKITHLAFEKVSETIEAPVKMDSVSLVLLRKFPYATIKFTGFHLGVPYALQNDSTRTYSDTLASLDHLYVSLKTKDLLDNRIEIKKIEIEGINVYYNIDSTGATNYDFLSEAFASTDTTEIEEEIVEQDTTPSVLDILLQDLTLKDITLNYSDATTNTKAKVHIPQIKLKGKVYDTYYAGNIDGSVILTNLGYENYNIDLMQKAYLEFDLGYVADSVTINNLNLESDGINLDVVGDAIIGDSIYMDLGIDLSKINLSELVKYAPVEMLDEFGLKKVEGVIDIDSKVKGYYYDSLLLPQVDIALSMTNGKIITKEYPPINHLSFNGTVSNGHLQNNSTMSANFSSFKLKTQSSSVDLAFKVKNIDNPTYSLKSSIFIDIDEFIEYIPDSTVEYITGDIGLKVETYGKLPKDLGINSADYFLDRTKLNLNLKNLSTAIYDQQEIKNLNFNFAYSPRRIDLTSLSFDAPSYKVNMSNSHLKAKILGTPTDIDHMGADIESFLFNIDGASIGGSAYFKDMNNPTYKVDTDIKLNLAELKPFIEEDMAKDISGLIDISIKSFGTINPDSIETQAMKLAFEQTELGLKIEDFMVKEAIKDPMYTVNDFDFNFEIAKDTILINNLFVDYEGIQFTMDSTEIWNVYKNILLEQKEKIVTVQTNMKINEINYDKLMAIMPPDEESSKAEDENSLPETENDTDVSTNTESSSDSVQYLLPNFEELGIPHFLFRGKLAIDYIKYEQNEIDDFSMLFRFADSLYVIDQMKFNTCKGHLNTSLKFDARKWDKPMVDIKNTITGLDLNEILVKNHEYVVESGITSENLSGLLTSELNARAFFFDGSWDPPTEKIQVKGHFTLKDGKIYNYEPLVELSNSLKVFGGLKGLDKLDFYNLETSIFMFKDKVYIPETDVATSSMDLSAFAMQQITTGKEDYEYHIEIFLKDIIAGKNDKLLKEQAKQSKKDGVELERNGLKLVAKDIEGDTKYGFDNEKLRKNLKRTIKMQNSFLNLLFNADLVNFSTDLDRLSFKKQNTDE